MNSSGMTEVQPRLDFSEGDGRPRPMVEIGWILAGRFDSPDLDAVQLCREQLESQLAEVFPEFRWRMPFVHRPEATQGGRVEPVELLDCGIAERDIKHWDFTFVLTGADLRAYSKPYCLAVISRAYDCGVFSTSRIDPAVEDPRLSRQERCEVMTARLAALTLHAFGHLNGLDLSDDPGSFQFALQQSSDLDHMKSWTERERDHLNKNLQEIADQRLEESSEYQHASAVRFYLHSGWRNRREILESIRQARPWEFPYRLSRLTVAALSTTFILLMTAEAWELGMSQPIYRAVGLPLITVLVTTIYVVNRQNLLARRRPRLSEQSTITNLSTFAIVLVGMLTTLMVLFVLAFSFSLFLFPRPLVEHWAESVPTIGWQQYVVLSLFISSFGIAIGALGASFEGQQYFRHVTYVDEEI